MTPPTDEEAAKWYAIITAGVLGLLLFAVLAGALAWIAVQIWTAVL